MATAQTTPRFDAAELRRAIEERDSQALTRLYADDAVVSIVDRDNPPSNPTVVRGREAIGAYFAELCGRDITHKVDPIVQQDETAAFEQHCQYPDGSRVLCIGVLELSDGLIARQTGLQAWDA
ncbi:MAG: nuclear transport factor 2 family protein [Thermoleophilaceae bacterium]